MNTSRFLLLVSIASILSACGGGGGGIVKQWFAGTK